MSERRAGLEKGDVSVESAEIGRRPLLTLEVSNRCTEPGRRGNGVDMCAKGAIRQHGKPRSARSKTATGCLRGTGPAGRGDGEVSSSHEASNDRGAKGPWFRVRREVRRVWDIDPRSLGTRMSSKPD